MARLKEVVSIRRVFRKVDSEAISLEIKIYCSETEANRVIKAISELMV